MDELSNNDRESVLALLGRSELQDIEFHEISAKKNDGFTAVEGEHQGGIEFSFQRRADSESFGIRFRAELNLPFGEATVAVAATYKISSGDVPDSRDIELFANEVAIMSMFPYEREGLATLAAKVFRSPVTLPVAQRGQIGFDID